MINCTVISHTISKTNETVFIYVFHKPLTYNNADFIENNNIGLFIDKEDVKYAFILKKMEIDAFKKAGEVMNNDFVKKIYGIIDKALSLYLKNDSLN